MKIPKCIYGTAEKSQVNDILTAISLGYRGLDSACQPQSYHEDVVGEAITVALAPSEFGGYGLRREELYIQTKFTTPAGHTNLCPYLPTDTIAMKVQKSLETSLRKLRLEYVDALLLHGPMATMAETLEVWKAMESQIGPKVRQLGLCNVSLEEANAVWEAAIIKPTIIQNRFWKTTQYGLPIRNYCRQKNIIYQPFWILKANPEILDSNLIGWFAESHNLTRENALFLLLMTPYKALSDVAILTGSRTSSRLKSTLELPGRMVDVPEYVMKGFIELLLKSSSA
jgi:diketogulonate reductase-like aldo/keto reductase